MTDHPNATLIRRGYAAFGAGDMATLDSVFADDVVWMVAGRHQLAGRYTGKAEVFGKLFAGLGERTGGTLEIEIETVVADDHQAVVLCHHTAEHGGRRLDVDAIDYYMIRGDRIVQARSTNYDASGVDAFYA